MQLEEYFDIKATDDIRLRGHRIGIESILYEYVHRGRTPEEIHAQFPTLSLDQIYATLLYFLLNKGRLSAYLEAWIEHGRRMRAAQERNPTPAMRRLREARAQASSTEGERSTSRASRRWPATGVPRG